MPPLKLNFHWKINFGLFVNAQEYELKQQQNGVMGPFSQLPGIVPGSCIIFVNISVKTKDFANILGVLSIY